MTGVLVVRALKNLETDRRVNQAIIDLYPNTLGRIYQEKQRINQRLRHEQALGKLKLSDRNQLKKVHES